MSVSIDLPVRHSPGLKRTYPRSPRALPWYAVLLTLVGATAILERFYGLSKLPVWMDEAYTYYASLQPIGNIIFGKIDNHPPLFYLVEHVWLTWSSDLAMLRVPAAVTGCVTVIAVALCTTNLIGRMGGLAAGAYLALSSSHIYFSQDARMYTLLTFGLCLATWGLVSLVQSAGAKLRWRAGIYVLGAAIAVYSQVLSLVYLLELNVLVLAAAFIARKNVGLYSAIAVSNVVLLVVSLPWLLTLREAMGTFPGLRPSSSLLLRWYFLNIVGFPGLPSLPRTLGGLIIVAMVLLAIVLAWKTGRKPLAVTLGGMFFLYPISIGVLNFKMAILSNRSLLPCLIPAAMMFGVAITQLRKPLNKAFAAALILLLSFQSSQATRQLATKPEDVPQALSYAAARGYGAAPVLTCNFFTAGTLHLYAPGRPVYFVGDSDTVFQFTDNILPIYSMPISERRRADSALAQRFAIEHHIRVDAADVVHGANRAVVVNAACESRAVAWEKQILTSEGFHQVDAPVLNEPSRVIFESVWTELTLWER